MTGRHAASDEVDDQALADQPYEPGAHAAPMDPQGQAETPPAAKPGRRAKGASS